MAEGEAPAMCYIGTETGLADRLEQESQVRHMRCRAALANNGMYRGRQTGAQRGGILCLVMRRARKMVRAARLLETRPKQTVKNAFLLYSVAGLESASAVA